MIIEVKHIHKSYFLIKKEQRIVFSLIYFLLIRRFFIYTNAIISFINLAYSEVSGYISYP